MKLVRTLAQIIPKIILALALVACFAHPAFAAARKKKDPIVPVQDDPQNYSLPVSQSEIKITPPPPIEVNHHEYELSVSSYAPKGFQFSSNLGNSSDFAKSGVPEISFNYLSKLAEIGENGILSTKFGLSYLGLERTAQFTGDYAHTAHESLNLFSVRIGAEYMQRNLLPWNLEPAVGLYVLPTWLVGADSEIDNGTSAIGFPIEASLDLLYHPETLSHVLGDSDLVIGLGLHDVYGSVQGADLSGLGVQGLLRLRM